MNMKKVHREVETCNSDLQVLQLIPLDKAAELLSVSTRTIRRMSQTGELPRIVKVGHSARMQLQGVVNYIARKIVCIGGMAI